MMRKRCERGDLPRASNVVRTRCNKLVCRVTRRRHLVTTLLVTFLTILRIVVWVLRVEGSGRLVVGVEWAGVWTTWVASSRFLALEERRIDAIHVGNKWKGVGGRDQAER